jgi:hypothetical protein
MFESVGIRQPLFVVQTIVELIEKDETRFSICKGAANKLYLSGKHVRYSTYDNILENLENIKKIIATSTTTKQSALQAVLDDSSILDFDKFDESRESRGLDDLMASRNDPNAPRRLVDMENTESLVPQKNWNIYYLTSIGYSIEESLRLMINYYSILPTRRQARHGGNDNPKLAIFKDYEKYIALHYEIYWTALTSQGFRFNKLDQIPKDEIKENAYKKTAERLLLKGITTGDDAFIIAAENIINFATWNGTKHKNAFQSSLSHWVPNARALTRFMKTIEDIKNEEMEKQLDKTNWELAAKEIREVDYQ